MAELSSSFYMSTNVKAETTMMMMSAKSKREVPTNLKERRREEGKTTGE